MVAHDGCENDGEMARRRDGVGGTTDDGMKARRRDGEGVKVRGMTTRHDGTGTSTVMCGH